MIGTDNNLYIPIGDVDGSDKGEAFETKAQLSIMLMEQNQMEEAVYLGFLKMVDL